MSMISAKVLELLESNPRRPDNEYEGKFNHLNFNWQAHGDDPDDVMEFVFSELRGRIPLSDFMDLAAQCIYRWLGKQESEANMKATLFSFLDAAFGNMSV